MKKKLIAALIILALMFTMTACSNETIVSVNVENDESINNGSIGKSSMIKIGDGLYYNSATRIVYWWNGVLSDPTNWNSRYTYSSITPSPYYAPNGLPYRYNPEMQFLAQNEDENLRYNPETNTLEEIEFPWQVNVTEDIGTTK